MEVTVDDQTLRLGEYLLEYLVMMVDNFDPSKKAIHREAVRKAFKLAAKSSMIPVDLISMCSDLNNPIIKETVNSEKVAACFHELSKAAGDVSMPPALERKVSESDDDMFGDHDEPTIEEPTTPAIKLDNISIGDDQILTDDLNHRLSNMFDDLS